MKTIILIITYLFTIQSYADYPVLPTPSVCMNHLNIPNIETKTPFFPASSSTIKLGEISTDINCKTTYVLPPKIWIANVRGFNYDRQNLINQCNTLSNKKTEIDTKSAELKDLIEDSTSEFNLIRDKQKELKFLKRKYSLMKASAFLKGQVLFRMPYDVWNEHIATLTYMNPNITVVRWGIDLQEIQFNKKFGYKISNANTVSNVYEVSNDVLDAMMFDVEVNLNSSCDLLQYQDQLPIRYNYIVENLMPTLKAKYLFKNNNTLNEKSLSITFKYKE